MKSTTLAVLAAVLGPVVWAQQFKFNLDHLASKASDSVDINLNGSMLQFAAKFLDGKDPDEAKVKQLLSGIEGIYVKNFEFKKEGEYSPTDLEQIRSQLKGPEWNRIVGVRSNSEGENVEVWTRVANGKTNGIAILAAEPKELTVVNLVGTIDLDALAALGGHFGIPKVEPSTPKKRE
jgi:Domain of unknown function (DUF4252)